MVFNALVDGGRRSGAGQQAIHPGWGKLLDHPVVFIIKTIALNFIKRYLTVCTAS